MHETKQKRVSSSERYLRRLWDDFFYDNWYYAKNVRFGDRNDDWELHHLSAKTRKKLQKRRKNLNISHDVHNRLLFEYTSLLEKKDFSRVFLEPHNYVDNLIQDLYEYFRYGGDMKNIEQNLTIKGFREFDLVYSLESDELKYGVVVEFKSSSNKHAYSKAKSQLRKSKDYHLFSKDEYDGIFYIIVHTNSSYPQNLHPNKANFYETIYAFEEYSPVISADSPVYHQVLHPSPEPVADSQTLRPVP